MNGHDGVPSENYKAQKHSAGSLINDDERGESARSTTSNFGGSMVGVCRKVQLKLLIAAIGIHDSVLESAIQRAGATNDESGTGRRTWRRAYLLRFRSSLRIIAEATSFIDLRLCLLSLCRVR